MKLSATINIKDKKSIPFDSPRAIFIHPPFLEPPTLLKVVYRFSLHHITVAHSLHNLSSKPSFNEYVEKHIRKNGYLSREIELALIETEARSSAAKNKGYNFHIFSYILSGWPYQKSSLPFLKEKFLSPHLICIFDLDQSKAEEMFEGLVAGDA